MSKFASLIVSLAASILLTALAWGIDQSFEERGRDAARDRVFNQLMGLRSSIELRFAAHVQVLQSIEAFVRTHSEIKRSEFLNHAAAVTTGFGAVQSLQLAPANQILHRYPDDAADVAAGPDVRFAEPFEQAVKRAQAKRLVATLGPVPYKGRPHNLAVIRPIMRTQSVGSDQLEYWGFALAIVDLEGVVNQVFDGGPHAGVAFGASDSHAHDLPGERAPVRLGESLRIAFVGSVEGHGLGTVSLGDADVLDVDAVIVPVNLPDGHWHLAAVPANGWLQGWEGRNFFWLGTLVLSLCVFVSLNAALRSPAHLRDQVAEATAALRATESRFRSLAAVAPVGIFRVDARGRSTYVNETFLHIVGREEALVMGANWLEWVHSDDRNAVEKELRNADQDSQAVEVEFRFQRPDGSEVFVLARNLTELDERGQVAGYVGTVTDITSHRQTERWAQLLSEVIEQNSASVVITDPEGTIEYVNPRFEKASGYKRSEIVGQRPSLLKSGYTTDDQYAEMWDTISGGRIWRGEFHNKTKDGAYYWEEATIFPIRDQSGAIVNYAAVKEDITQRKTIEEELLRQTNFDAMTGLPNRVLALDRLEQAMSKVRREGSLCGVLFIDVDDLKKVNDTLGHDQGDRVLAQIASRLRHVAREGDTLARLGGDEFLTIVSEVPHPVFIEQVAQRMVAACAEPFEIDEHEVFITIRIGISIFPNDGDDAQSILRNAHGAMYRAKDKGGNTYNFFTAELKQLAQQRLDLESHLRHALERGELELNYQPLVDIDTERPIGAEALLRWNSTQLGRVSPETFVPLAEQIGVINEIGDWVLDRACQDALAWERDTGQALKIAVNVSPLQFKGTRLLDNVSRVLSETGLQPGRLEIEITERLLMAETQHTMAVLEGLSELGVELSIDDFGTGYSSLSYLRRFPFDVLKIDRAFVSGVTRNKDDAIIATVIVGMAHSLGLTVIGEGVETEDQLAFLRDKGCDVIQGYYYAKPMSQDDFIAYLKQFD